MQAVDEGAYDVGVSHDLARLLISKLGSKILDNKEIRKRIVDGLDEGMRDQLRNQTSLSDSKAETLRRYFGGSWTEIKSKQFVDALDLDSQLIKVTVDDTRRHFELVNPAYGEKASLKGFLHYYQKIVKDEINSRLEYPGDRLMLQMPTGSGKTYTALETFVDLIRSPSKQEKRICVWLVNSPELAEQAFCSFRDLWNLKGDKPLKIWRLFNKWGPPDFEQLEKDSVIFSTYKIINNILTTENDGRRPNLDKLIDNTEFLIVDEAHGAIATTYKFCIERFLRSDKTKMLGLSATPIRQNTDETDDLVRLFYSNLATINSKHDGSDLIDPIRYLQQERYLAKLNIETFTTEVNVDGGRETALLASLTRSKKRNKLIIEQIEAAHQRREKTILFACSVSHVLILQMMCREHSIPVEIITEETSSIERQYIFERFSNDPEFYVLLNYEILSTGIDLPNVNTVMLTRPLHSSVQYSQMIGRALRGPRNGGNEENKVINLKDNIHNFGRYESLFKDFDDQWSFHNE